MPTSDTLLRQLSRRDPCGSSRSWSKRIPKCLSEDGRAWEPHRKNVVVVVDASPQARIAMLWALSHLVNRADTLTLLHVIENEKPMSDIKPKCRSKDAKRCHLTTSLRAICKARRPEVEVETVVIEGEKATTIINQAKKLKASVLILGQRKPSLFHKFFRSKKEEFIDYCIHHAECLTLGVSKQSNSIGGYLINSKWHKNFWLLA
eukprot:Gb_04683 [translate_table: standard]